MGHTFSGLFGSHYEEPSYDPAPTREEAAEPESQAVRDAERKKLRAKQGMTKNILTSPLGVNGSAKYDNGLLGRKLS